MTTKMRFLAVSLALFFAGGARGAGGRVESLDLLDKIRPGTTNAQQVRELLGPPARTLAFPARGLEALEYEARDFSDHLVISITVGRDGLVREILRLRRSGF